MRRIQQYRSGRRRGTGPGDAGELFHSEPSLRPMVVLVDAELVDAPASGPDTRSRSQQLLDELLKLDTVVVHRYADGGPPPGTPSSSTGFGIVFPGWAVVAEQAPRHWGVVYGTEERWTHSGVHGEVVDVDVRDPHTTAYSDQSAVESAARRRADRLAAQVAAQALEADLFITERPYLHEAAWPVAHDTAICSVDDSLALLGLYLRAQGKYHIAHNYKFNRGLFTWVATRELLPSAWRWFTCIVRSGSAIRDDRLTILGGSLLQRFQRALVARDAVLIALNQRQDNDVRDDALSALDDVGYRLMGAFDVLARAAHRVCGLSGKERNAGWQNQNWLNDLAVIAPKLAEVMDPDKEGAKVLTIVRLLRNTIHGEALQGLHVLESGRPGRSLVALNAEDEAEILKAMDALGGRARWGVEVRLPGRFHVDPGVLVEELFVDVIPLLNELMDHTPVESLPEANVTAADLGPPTERGSPFSEVCRFSIRKQYGF